MKRSDLDLRPVLLLDRVQKHQRLAKDEVRSLKSLKLIEGRAPNYHISAKVADWTGQKARYIHNRGLDDDYYNPDWALLVKKKRCRTIILVVETKGGLFADDHRKPRWPAGKRTSRLWRAVKHLQGILLRGRWMM